MNEHNEKIEQLQRYVYSQLQQGMNPDEVSHQLRAGGWDEPSIAAAFSGVQSQMVPTAVDGEAPSGEPGQFLATGKKRGRIKTAWQLMKQSLRVLNSNRQLVRYPLMGTVWATLLTIVAVIVFIVANDVLAYEYINYNGETDYNLTPAGFAAMFVFYVLMFFFIFTYNAGLAAHTLDVFRGKSGEYSHYMKLAWSKKMPILVYSAITTTVGLILRIIEDRFRWLGWIISRVLGTAWQLANLFTIPVIMEEDVTASAAIKKSTKLFISRWGENVAARVGFGGLMFLVYLVLFIPLAVVLVMLSGVLTAALGYIGLILTMLLLVAIVIVFAAIETAASNVLSTALYYYATTAQIPAAFDRELLNAALVPKKQKKH